MGGADYKSFAPPKSFIDVKDFNSPKDLAEYLLYLDKNQVREVMDSHFKSQKMIIFQTAYREYFQWKRDYVGYSPRPICNLCSMLHDRNRRWQSYEDLDAWFNYQEDGWTHQCQNGLRVTYLSDFFCIAKTSHAVL